MPQTDGRQLYSAIFVGGVAGALLRAALVTAFPAPDAGWPWVIFTVNIAGTAALGYFVTRLQERLPLSTYRRPFLGTGLCGALTTFSTMQVELLEMIDAHRFVLAASYAGTSVLAGLPRDPPRHRTRPPPGDAWRDGADLGRRRGPRRNRRGRPVHPRRHDRRRARAGFPLGNSRRQRQRVAACSGSSPGSGPVAPPSSSPGRRCSAPTRRFPPGCSRPTGWPRRARAATPSRNIVLSLALGLAAAALGRTLGMHL